MREIKFRSWNYADKRMVSWDEMRDDHYDLYQEFKNNHTIMQFTGLKDKNGKEIYDGDIVKYNDGDVSHHRIFFDEKYGRWFDERLEDGDSQTAYDDFSFVTECKIVGNIYQNTEWL